MWFPKALRGWLKACSTNPIKRHRRWSRWSRLGASAQIAWAGLQPLEDRTLLSGLTEFLLTPVSEDVPPAMHIHVHLSIVIDGQSVVIPEGIGDTPDGHLPIHTHDDTGRLHIESPVVQEFHLQDFFTVSGQTFTSHEILGHQVDASHFISMTVASQGTTHGTTAFGEQILHDDDRIVISYGATQNGPLVAPQLSPLMAQPSPIDGIPANCPSIDIVVADIPDGGWTWVNPSAPIQQLTGRVNPTIELDPTEDDLSNLSSFVTYTDLPTAHNSHDQNVHITVDEEFRGLLSLINDLGDDHADIASSSDIPFPNQIEVEWETGILPGETTGDGHGGVDGGPIFPKWAWANPGDRIWLMGHHIYDCGHPIEVAGEDRYKSEIHPPIASAAMRDQVMTLPGTGATPVPVVATDLYIHGDGGWATSVLNTHEVFDQGTYYTTPIDRDYDFDIHLPVKPDPAAVLQWTVSDGPNNNINIAPVLTPDLSDPADPKLHVHVPLAGSGVADLDTYGRQIVAGWAVPQEGVRHLQITLNQMVLHTDMEIDGADGELSFFWLNVPNSPTEWQRLSDHEIPTFEDPGVLCADQTNTMDTFDDDAFCGNGILNFSGPTFDLFVMDGTPVSIQARGYDQDCLDDVFGVHSLAGLAAVGACYLGNGDNDPYKTLKVDLMSPSYSVGSLNVSNPDNQYELHFTVTELPPPPQPRHIDLPAGGGSYELFVDGPDLVLRRLSGAELFRMPQDGVTKFTVNGSAENDSLTINEGFGIVNTPISFVGGGHTGAPGDRMIVRGTDGDDALVVTPTAINSANMTFNGVPPQPVISFLDIYQFAFEGQAGSDAMTVDSSTSLLGLAGGIQYDGGTGFDLLKLLQTGGAMNSLDTYSVGPALGAGTSTITGPSGTQVVFFQNLEPVIDLVPSALFTVNATPADNTITYTAGSLSTRGLITVDNFESVEFDSKTSLLINAGNGADSVNLNDSTQPTGLTGITVNTGLGNNAVVLANLPASTPATVNGSDGDDLIDGWAVTAAALSLSGGDGNDTIRGGAAGDTLTGGAGNDKFTDRGGTNSISGGSGGDTILVNGSAADDTISLRLIGANLVATVNGVGATYLGIAGASIEQVNIIVGEGNDLIDVDPLAAIPIFVDGGDPIGVKPGDVLTVHAGGLTATANPGPENDEGSVSVSTKAPVSYDHIETLVIDGAGSAVINGTNGPDSITVIARDASTHAGADGVRDFTVSMNTGAEILYLNVPALTVNALAGSDEIDLQTPAPNNADWDVDVTIDGGPPAASDRLVIETPGAAAENVGYTPTAPDAGAMTITESDGLLRTNVIILGIESLVYVGRGDNDRLAVIGNGDDNTIRHTPAANDGGTIAVDLTLPIIYQNLGTGGAPVVNGLGGTDTLIYDGTLGSDTFSITGGGIGQVNLNAHLPLLTGFVEILQLLGKSGDDTFSLVPAISASPYTTINIDGGSQASATGDVVNLVSTAAADSIMISGQNVGAGGNVVNSIGVENINLDSGADSDLLTYNGVPGVKENIQVYGSTTPGSGQITVPDVTKVTFLNSEAILVNGNAADVDTLTFYATNAIDTLQIKLNAAGTAGDPVLKLQNATGSTTQLTLNNYTGFDTLNVNAGDGNDVVNVYTSKTGSSRNLFVDGGLPTGKNKGTDTMNVFYSGKRPRIVQSAATQNPSSGLVTLDYGTAFFRVAYAGMEIVTIQK